MNDGGLTGIFSIHKSRIPRCSVFEPGLACRFVKPLSSSATCSTERGSASRLDAGHGERVLRGRRSCAPSAAFRANGGEPSDDFGSHRWAVELLVAAPLEDGRTVSAPCRSASARRPAPLGDLVHALAKRATPIRDRRGGRQAACASGHRFDRFRWHESEPLAEEPTAYGQSCGSIVVGSIEAFLDDTESTAGRVDLEAVAVPEPVAVAHALDRLGRIAWDGNRSAAGAMTPFVTPSEEWFRRVVQLTWCAKQFSREHLG